MKKLLIITCLSCAISLVANAAEGEAKKEGEAHKGAAPTQEQKALRKELVEKYDTDKSGKLSKEEKSKMTAEDQAKWSSLAPAKKKEAGEASHEKAKEHKEGDKK